MSKQVQISRLQQQKETFIRHRTACFIHDSVWMNAPPVSCLFIVVDGWTDGSGGNGEMGRKRCGNKCPIDCDWLLLDMFSFDLVGYIRRCHRCVFIDTDKESRERCPSSCMYCRYELSEISLSSPSSRIPCANLVRKRSRLWLCCVTCSGISLAGCRWRTIWR